MFAIVSIVNMSLFLTSVYTLFTNKTMLNRIREVSLATYPLQLFLPSTFLKNYVDVDLGINTIAYSK